MVRRLRSILLFGIFFNLLFLAVYPVLQGQEETTKLIVGESKSFSTRAPSRVVIGNPVIADIGDVTNTEISVSAKSPGVTNLVFWDVFGEQSVKIKVVAEDMSLIKSRVDNLLNKLNIPTVYTQAEDDESKVYILGTVKTPQDKERVSVTLGTLKDKIVDLIKIKEEESVVKIDVQVLELDKDATDTLGFTWPGSITITEQGSPGILAAGTKWSTLFKVLNLNRAQFSWTLDALIQEGKARILSRPNLACQSGKEAELLVGGEKPILTTNTVTGGGQETNVEYKEYGIKLKIKPTVTEENRVKLAVNVEVSDVGTADILGTTAAPTAKAYPLTKRSASTELFLADGQTLSIGGLIKQKTEEDLRKVPWLGDVPVLGLFFRKKTTKQGGGTGERGSTELFISITPTIVTEKKEETKVSLKEAVKPARPKEDITDPKAIYAQLIQKRVLENLIYPPEAKKSGFQGTVKLSLRLTYIGELLDVTVKSPSGYKILDDAALAAAKSSSSYPPFPSTIQEAELWVDVPITYQLD